MSTMQLDWVNPQYIPGLLIGSSELVIQYGSRPNIADTYTHVALHNPRPRYVSGKLLLSSGDYQWLMRNKCAKGRVVPYLFIYLFIYLKAGESTDI